MTWRKKADLNFAAYFSPLGRSVITLSTCCVELQFDIFELTANNRLGKRLIHLPGTMHFSTVKWNGEDEFFFGNATGIDGGASVTGRSNEYGFYAIASIYRYDFKTHRAEKVIEGRANRSYLLKDVIPKEGLIVTGFAPKESPTYAMELREMDGSELHTIYTSNKEISYIGRIKAGD